MHFFCLTPEIKGDDDGEHGEELVHADRLDDRQISEYDGQDDGDDALHRQEFQETFLQDRAPPFKLPFSIHWYIG